jgi:hypothetical protein
MKLSGDPKTQKFIEDLKILDSTKFQIVQNLREIVFDIYPDTKERIMYGGIMLSGSEDFGGIFAYEKHISFEFSFGYKFNDPDNFLEGKGKYRRHLKLRSIDDIEAKKVAFYVKQVEDLTS